MKQSQKNSILAKIKSKLDKRCVICGCFGNDLAHLLPKSIYPEHYTNEKNLVIMCRNCHNSYDNSLSFRKLQKKLFKQICEFDEMSANRYFRTYE